MFSYVPSVVDNKAELDSVAAQYPKIKNLLAPRIILRRLLGLKTTPLDVPRVASSLRDRLVLISNKTDGYKLVMVDTLFLDQKNNDDLRRETIRAFSEYVPLIPRICPVFSVDKNIKELNGRWPQIGLRVSAAILMKRETLNEAVSSISRFKGEVRLIVDLGKVGSGSKPWLPDAVAPGLNSLLKLDQALTLIISCGSFPSDIHTFPHNKLTQRKRWELEIFEATNSKLNTDKPVIFGDHTSVNRDFMPFPLGKGRRVPRVWYTGHRDFHFSIGFADEPAKIGKQYTALAREIQKLPDFGGRDLSEGDKILAQCAAGRLSGLSREQANFVAINHHLAAVGLQMTG